MLAALAAWRGGARAGGGGDEDGDGDGGGRRRAPTRVQVGRVEELVRGGGLVDVPADACKERLADLRRRAREALRGLPQDAFTAEDLEGVAQGALAVGGQEDDGHAEAEAATELTVFDCERALQMVLARLPEERTAKRFLRSSYCDPDLEALRQVIEDFRADGLHLVQGARLLERHVQFELSYVLSQFAKKDREAAATQRKILVCERNIKTHHRAFQDRCDDLGIPFSVDLAGELQRHAAHRLPDMIRTLRRAIQSPAIASAIDYYDAFRESQGGPEVGSLAELSSLRRAREEEDLGEADSLGLGRDEAPLESTRDGAAGRSPQDTLAATKTDHAPPSGKAFNQDDDDDDDDDDDGIDWDIDLGQDGFEAGDELAHAEGGGASEPTQDEEPDGHGHSLHSAEMRDAVLSDLLVLCAFLRQRLAEMKAPSGDSAAMAWLDASHHTTQPREDVASLLAAVVAAENLIQSRELTELATIHRGGPHFQRLLLELEQLRGRETKSRSSVNRLTAKRVQLQDERVRLVPRRNVLEKRIRVLKADMEAALRDAFDGKPFVISGIAKFL